MKKNLVVMGGLLLAFGANAEVSKFEGPSATVALAYQSYSSEPGSIVTSGGLSLTAPNSASKGIVGKIGLEYTWNLGDGQFMTVGTDYSLSEGGRGEIDFQFQGTSLAIEGVKHKQKAKVFIAPSSLIDQDTLGYIKLGYAQYQSKFLSDNSKNDASAITFGLGAKFMASEKGYFFSEVNWLSGRSKTWVSEDGTIITAKPKGSEILFGYGVKF